MNNSKYKILLVEDEKSLLLVYSEYLRMEGFKVIEAADGKEALEKANEHIDIDLVLLDVVLPRVNGLKVLEKLKKDARTRKFIVYMMTVLGSNKVIKKAFELGADGYIVKDTLNQEDIKREILIALENRNKQGYPRLNE